LVNWILVIPALLWASLLGIAALVVSILAWFAILITGRLPESWGDFLMGYVRYQWRITAYLFAWTETYPSFAVPAGYVDPGEYPAVAYCARAEQRSRLTVLFRFILIIPQYILLYFVTIVARFVELFAWFAVLVTGRWPDGLRNFLIGYHRWLLRVQAYGLLITDTYPPFGFQP
jgi:hypothetical protein